MTSPRKISWSTVLCKGHLKDEVAIGSFRLLNTSCDCSITTSLVIKKKARHMVADLPNIAHFQPKKLQCSSNHI